MTHSTRVRRLLHQYFEQLCPECGGTTWILEEGVARRCSCYTQNLEEHRLEISRIPPSYFHCSLDNFQTGNNYSLKIARDKARRFADSFLTTPDMVGRGLLLRGAVGVGKTHLAVAILKALVDKGFNGFFFNFVHLIEQIKQSYDSERDVSEPDILRHLRHCQVVVMDELGATKPSEFVFNKLYDVINSCFDKKISVIFTTNYLDAIPRPASSGPQTDFNRTSDLMARAASPMASSTGFTLAERINERLRSRILERCEDLVLDGPDYRLGSAKRPASPAPRETR